MNARQGLINVKIFQARTEGVTPEGPRADVGFLGRGATSPFPPARGSGERCKLPSGVWAKIEFDTF